MRVTPGSRRALAKRRLVARRRGKKRENSDGTGMQLSTRGRYAVMAMTELAGHEDDRAVSLAAIAERQQISRPYLEQLFARLRRRGLVNSVRGPGGGYRLARPAADLSVAA